MTDDLDRFDRMLLASEGRAASNATAAPSRAAAPWGPRLVPLERRRAVDPPPHPPRYVDYTECPLCDSVNLGIEYHGQLMSGAKVHMLAAHSADKRSVVKGRPRCLGSGLRIVFTRGSWEGMK